MLSFNVIKTIRINMKYLSAALNSSVIRFWLRFKGNMQGLNFQIDAGPIQQIPVANPKLEIQEIIAVLVSLTQNAYKISDSFVAHFFEDLIDACVMECYFQEHMMERDLLFINELTSCLTDYNLDASESLQCKFIVQLYEKLNNPSSKIRNRLLRISADSPDLLAVIKEEGKV